MVTISVVNLTNEYLTNKDGNIVFETIVDNFNRNRDVVISFKEISGINSSFVNSAFIQLLDHYDFKYIKKHLTFKDSNRQINNLIKHRFSFENNKKMTL